MSDKGNTILNPYPLVLLLILQEHLCNHPQLLVHLFNGLGRFPGVFIFIISFPMNKVLLTILGDPMVRNSFNGILCIFVIWKGFEVTEMLRIIVVVFEHVWGEDWVSGLSSWNVESKVAVLIDIRDLVRSSPDCL